MNATADTLRVVLALYHFEVWSPERIARALRLRPRDVVSLIEVLQEFQFLSNPNKYSAALKHNIGYAGGDDDFI